jgi:perosamine synthetase
MLEKKIPITQPSITELEIEYVNDAIKNGWGAKCYDYINSFEKSFATYQNSAYSLATSSCTGAIHLALLALGVKAGDEVIVPEITWIASVEPVLYIGAKPVFVDVLYDSWCIDPKKVEEAITPKTKAIIVVHLYGNLVEMEAIMAIAKKYGLVVLEDAAEGLGSEYKGKKAGSIADAGVFSFHGTKTMTTGEGGMIVTDRHDLYERVKVLNDHGRNPKIGKTFWMEEYGYKYKLSNLQAALGCAQISRMNDLVQKKRKIFNLYKELLADESLFQFNLELPGTKNSYWMPTVVFAKSLNIDREKLFANFKEKNIDARPFFYPLSSLPMFEAIKENSVSYDLYMRGIILPSYHDITPDDQIRVITIIKNYLESL